MAAPKLVFSLAYLGQVRDNYYGARFSVSSMDPRFRGQSWRASNGWIVTAAVSHAGPTILFDETPKIILQGLNPHRRDAYAHVLLVEASSEAEAIGKLQEVVDALIEWSERSPISDDPATSTCLEIRESMLFATPTDSPDAEEEEIELPAPIFLDQYLGEPICLG
jgi:hypothetical protein